MINESLQALINTLKEKFQDGDGRWTAKASQRLGISESYLYKLEDGIRQPGSKFYEAVIREFPDLQLMVFQIIAKGR